MKRKCLGVFLVSLFLGISPCIAQAQEDQILYSETKYFKTVEDNMGLMYTTTEITEEEYIAAQGVSLMGSYFNTNYKRLTIGASSNNVNLDLQWTAVPAVKSYDVIALRGEGIKFNTSTLTGNQSYMKDGSYGAVAYTKDRCFLSPIS